MFEGKTGFVRFDLAITRETHRSNILNGTYLALDPDVDPVLTVKAEQTPNFKDLQDLLEKVGRPYGWHLREEYNHEASIREISQALKNPASKRFSFWAGKKEVGGAIIANIEDVGRIFAKAHDDKKPTNFDPALAKKTIEIYKIGFFQEYTGRGLGKFFLPFLLDKLLNDESEHEIVYLNTRSTNHSGVLRFYTGLNLDVIHGRSFPNDLISEQSYQDRKNAMSAIGTTENNHPAPSLS